MLSILYFNNGPNYKTIAIQSVSDGKHIFQPSVLDMLVSSRILSTQVGIICLLMMMPYVYTIKLQAYAMVFKHITISSVLDMLIRSPKPSTQVGIFNMLTIGDGL